MHLRSILGLALFGALVSCETVPPPPPPPPAYCPPAQKKAVPHKEPVKENPRLRQVNGRTIEDVPPEEVEPVKSVLDIKR